MSKTERSSKKEQESRGLSAWDTSPDYTMQAVQCRLLLARKQPTGNGYIKQAQDGRLMFFNDKDVFAFQMVRRSEQRKLEDFLLRNFVNKASVMDLRVPSTADADAPADGGTFFLHIVFFVKETIRTALPIVCSGKVMGALAHHGFGTTEGNQLQKLKQQLNWPCFVAGSETYTYLAYAEKQDFRDIWSGEKSGEANDGAAKGQEQELPTLSEGAEMKPVRRMIFFGPNFQLHVGIYRSKDEPDEEIWLAEKFTTNRRSLPCMRLLRVTEFSLMTQRELAAAAVKTVLEKEGSYIETWRHYADMEGEILLDKLRRIGQIHYSIASNLDADGNIAATAVEHAENLDLLEKGDKMFCFPLDQEPAYMRDGELGWSAYESYVKRLRKEGMTSSLEIVRMDYQQNRIWFKPTDGKSKPFGDRLYLDDYKYRKQIERRERARNAIQTGRSANPKLGFIINGEEEESSLSLDVGLFGRMKPVARKRISPFSYSTMEELKQAHREPTPTQKDAISMALNTPDIAIIQGPPGTGKTTVITAILKRLNEVLSKDELAHGRVLVTSLQHDAVYNVINRVAINSLPIIKFGKRHNLDDEPDENVVDETVHHWCDALRDRLLAKHPKITESAASHQLAEAYRFYALKPTSQNAADFLAVARRVTVEKDLLERIRQLEERYKPFKSEVNADMLAAIRRLWSSPRAFADGGSTRAAEVLALLEPPDAPEASEAPSDTEDGFIRSTLEAASSWTRLHGAEPVSEDLRQKLRRCRQLLLARCIPRPRYQLANLDDDVTALYADIKQALAKPEGEADNILYSLLSQLEYDQEGIKETLKNYMFAYAATAQQSDSKEIQEAKGGHVLEYDTVIVDEAARVNPGDLMIPLSQAKRRIILVGDHRQLPHMYDEEVFDRLLEKGATFCDADIQQSMFENLLGTARRLERKDGIKRFITLDVQYRMHPLLGKFVSDNFYAKHDQSEAFRSELPAEHFAQPFTPQPMLWIDVPVRKAADREQRLNPSWMRQRECEVIIRKIRSMMDTMEGMPEQRPLSIGVISFYSGQVRCLKGMIKEQGWTEDQIKVGTVDAYQGMEYDIIFLSIVRATLDPAKINWRAVEDPKAKQHARIGRRHYGFLTSENRLCVALSRQKRLLVVVGNGALFSGPYGSRLAAAYVPALKAFYELCEQKGAVVHE